MIRAALHNAINRARRHGGAVSGIYLTRQHTDALLAETGQRHALDRFSGLPVYPNRDVSMVVYVDQAGDGNLVLL